MTSSNGAERRREAAIAGLGQRVRAAVAAAVPRGARVALLDFPEYGNVGDSVIWLGQLAAIRAAGATVEYAASVASYDGARLRRNLRPGEAVVLLSGGGNFGDLWPLHGELRKRVLSELPDFRIVQLPQSIHFNDPRNVDATRNLLKGHGSFTLMVRDEASKALAQERLDQPVVLCPDVAFALGPVARPVAPEQPIVWLSRDDQEGPATPTGAGDGPARIDWVDEPDLQLPIFDRVLARWKAAGGPVSARWIARSLHSRAAIRMRHGARMLARGHVVVTNRLHGMILSMLMGVPQFVSDTRQGKISAFHGTWLRDALPGVMCATEREALARGRALAESLAAEGAHEAG